MFEIICFGFCVVIGFCCYHVGRLVGRSQITDEDREWHDRIRSGYGPR